MFMYHIKEKAHPHFWCSRTKEV